MGEYLQSIKAHLYDRAVSPLFGTFTAAWVFWNYKLIVILLSPLDVAAQFAYIDLLYPNIAARATTGFVYPFFSSLGFIFVYPFLAEPIYKFARERQKALLEIKRIIEDETLLSVKDSQLIKKEAFSRALEFERVLEERNGIITQLKEKISELQQVETSIPISKPPKKNDIAEFHELSAGQIAVLDKVAASATGGIFQNSLVAAHGQSDRNLALFELGELVRLKFMETVSRRNPSEFEDFYRITHEGRRVLANKYENVLTPTTIA